MKRSHFVRVVEDFRTHRHICRVVERNSIYMSATSMPSQALVNPVPAVANPAPAPAPSKNIVYTAMFTRGTADDSQRLAMTSTYFGGCSANCGIFFGCEDSDFDAVKKAITHCETAWNHPLLLVCIFLELQTKRLRNEAKVLVREAGMITANARTHRENPRDSLLNLAKDAEEMSERTKVFEKDALAALKQLSKLIAHAESLMDVTLQPGLRDFDHDTTRFICRFKEIWHEYEEIVSDCRINVEAAIEVTGIVSAVDGAGRETS